MSILNNAYGDTIEARLRYIGATDIRKINGLLYFIEFEIADNLKVLYTYNINTKNKYFLQRIKPYPIPEGVFEKEYEVVSFIERDIKKFNNAKNSNNFNLFLEITSELNTICFDIEHLFLNYNIDKMDLYKLKSELDDILNLFDDSKKRSPQINIDSK
ncbi:hypothetical protein NE452_06715 [Paeniclostridium sordellii]|uniref:hypothetical protein n=1 Tax=Paraclostridium sordellii TaxID=1505 RepID=UPI0005DB4E7A|nr:hypothetical protein [Paeniclostridium sordellii]MCQ4697213.1 hypothetical protein [Paeniclostridium sordellii]CEN84329.1 Uncharacterised protein [[Clostridium] sordellii] [Paeniclostridium sordellii]CEO11712.1 Uncharacterised protein [[Clostridium] sordellii] [Paeniclostridium sordellii]